MLKRSLAVSIFLGLFLLPLFASEGNQISVITIDDQIINPVIAEYIDKAVDEAEASGYQALIIQLDTPGGLLSSTRQIVKKILNAKVPIIVYVSPSGARAGSAGVFITLASHVAAMAPSTNIGAAHPVEFGESPRKRDDSFREVLRSLKKEKQGAKKDKKEEKTERKEEVPETDPMAGKILNDTVAWISTIAKSRGRNVEWAVRAVKESISDGEGEALRQGVIDVVAKDTGELLKKIDNREIRLASGEKRVLKTEGVRFVTSPMTLRQRVLSVLINPNIAYILMILGFYGLLYEITHPGVWFPGVAGLICIILAFYAFHTLPTNYAGLALIFLALGLFIAEAFVTSYGFLSIVGVVSMLLGSLFLIDSAADFMQVSLTVVIPVVAATAGIFVFLVTLAVRAQRQKSVTGVEGLVGTDGVMQKGNKVFVAGEIWDAVSDVLLTKGDKVRVVSVEGMRTRVKKIT